MNDTVKLEVIRLFPDSFPDVSVIFRASGPNGEAIKNLDTANVRVTENDHPCKVVSVKRISNDWAVNTALVVDHSGSMSEDALLRRHWDSLPANAFTLSWITMRDFTDGEVDSDSMMAVRIAPPNPAWYHTPLWYAQRAASSYVSKTDAEKDQNSLIGFSTDVDITSSLSGNRESINGKINSLTASGETAFYDAVSRAIDEADKGSGIRVVIAMTDGKDNNSRQSLSDVITKAQAKKIPVYVIGLGDVDQSPLKKLARETGGLSYFTNEASSLSGIYTRITAEIQSIYEVIYETPSLSSTDSLRNTQLIFDVDGKYLSAQQLSFMLPPEVVDRINAQEAALHQQTIVIDPSFTQTAPEIPWGYIGLCVAVVSAGVLTARYVKRKPKRSGLSIVRLYPNPASVQVTVEVSRDLSLSPTIVNILDGSGTIVHHESGFAGTSLTINLPELPSGNYVVSVATEAETVSKAFVVAR